MVGSLCGLLAGNTLGAQTLSMLKPFVLQERSGVLVFFLRVDMWENKTIKAWYLFSTLMNWPYQLLLLQVFFGGFITVTRHRDGVFLCAWSIFVGFCWQALRPKPQLHYHFSSGLCVSWSDFSKGKVFAVVNFWIPQKSHGFSSLTIYHKH